MIELCLKPVVSRLLDLKINAPKINEIPRVDESNAYLDQTIEELKVEISACPMEHRADWPPLNELFLMLTIEINSEPM